MLDKMKDRFSMFVGLFIRRAMFFYERIHFPLNIFSSSQTPISRLQIGVLVLLSFLLPVFTLMNSLT